MFIGAGQKIVNASIDTQYAGTIGGAILNGDNDEYLLTCFHCIYAYGFDWKTTQISAANPNAQISDGLKFFQAGRIIKVLRDFYLDVALIQPLPGNNIEKHIGSWGSTNGKRDLTDDDAGVVWLKKFNFKTGQMNYGRFDGFQSFYGDFYRPETNIFYLHDLIRIVTPFSGQSFAVTGDSGSFVLDSDNKVAGVVVMVANNVTYAMKASHIEENFQIKFI